MQPLYYLLLIVFFIAATITDITVSAQDKPANHIEIQIEEEFEWLREEAINVTVITASRTETPLLKVTKSINLISPKDMAEAQEYFLPEMIDNVPGLFLKRNGGVGQLCRISMRGAEAQYTQIQYNGIPLKDAADLQNTFNPFIQDLYMGSNHRVEVLRGSNSTLHGSQAMAGVINIIPDKWHQGLKMELRNEIGEKNTYIENARLAYGADKYFIDFNPTYIDTDGGKNDGVYDYGYKKFGFSLGAGIKSAENLSMELTSLFSDNDAALSLNSPSLDTEHNLVKNQASKDQHHENRFYHLGGVLTHTPTSFWDYTLKAAYGNTQRQYFWSDISGDQSVYKGSTAYYEMQHNLYPTNWLTLTIGTDYEASDYQDQEPFDSYQGIYDPVTFDHEWYVWDIFTNLQFSFLDESLSMNIGGRYNDHEKFDAKGVWEASFAYILKKTGTKFHSHVGSGYRTPSIYEIYGGYLFMGDFITVGNPDLEPEESLGYEIGIDQFLLENRIHMGLTYFKMDFDHLVIYDLFESRYKNASKSRTDGIEAYLNLKPCKYFKASMAYTHANPEYQGSGAEQWTRKEHFSRNKLNMTATFYPLEHLTTYFRITWMDDKIVPLYDPNFNQVRWEEDSVTTVDMALTYEISKNLDAWVRAENLLDEDYSEGGYTMPGRWVYGGFRLDF